MSVLVQRLCIVLFLLFANLAANLVFNLLPKEMHALLTVIIGVQLFPIADEMVDEWKSKPGPDGK